jgi:RNA polymerase sigma-70 factor (ECF subfamily)
MQQLRGLRTMWIARTVSDARPTAADVSEGMAEAIKLSERKWAKNPEELVELYSDEVWRFTSSQLSRREDAEDIAMEVFAAACSNFDKLIHAYDQRLWLLGIARKKVAGFLRQRYRRAEQPLTDDHIAEAAIGTTEVQEAVRTGIRGLPHQQGEALVLKYVNGLSTEEVSLVIKKSMPATNSLLQRARAAFREAIGPAGEDYTRITS